MNRIIRIFCAAAVLSGTVVPGLLQAYEFGPNPGYTAAPGDNPTACVSAGCHVGTVNSGTGGVKITLPAGNSGTYVPGQAMQILVQITDSTKLAYGFQLTARMGSGNATQSGDFATTDTNTQVLCADGSAKANGKLCSTTFPVQYIEHNAVGYEASIKATPKGAYTYAFNWTPPAGGSGPVTLYAAANCGPGDPPVTTPTNIYTTKTSLTEATGAAITGVFDAESARPSFTSGQWVAIYGSGLANSSRFWIDSDFSGGTSTGSPLPSKLDGVSVTFGGQAASVYYISPTQLNVLTPSNLAGGPVSVVVTNNGSTATFTGTVVSASPSFFYYGAGASLYPLAVHLSGKLVGDPAVLSNSEKAHPGETLQFFINGIAAATGGTIVPVTQFPQQASISADSTPLTASAPFLVFSGEFQVNGTLPASIANGNYALSITVPGGSTSDSGVTVLLPVGP